MTLRTIHLHGRLGERFGAAHQLDVATPAEAVRALCVLHPGFAEQVREGAYRVVRGGLESGMELAGDGLHLTLGRCVQLHFVPVIEGAGGRGFGKIVLGVALVGAAMAFAPAAVAGVAASGMATPIASIGTFAVTFNTIASLGVSLALTGISQALAPNPSAGTYKDREKPDQRASFLFNGPVNAGTEGAVIPLIYGKHLVGSVVVAAGIDVYDTDNAKSANNGGL